jgi:short-subunit dehydrogenase
MDESKRMLREMIFAALSRKLKNATAEHRNSAIGLLAGLGVVAVVHFLRRYTFRGRVVLITGGSRGLGLVMAREFGAKGASLMLVARDGEELDRAAVELRSTGVRVETYVGDVAEASVPEAAVTETMRTFGRLDVLINNAGMILVGPLENMTEEDFARAMAIHFWAPLRFMTAARGHLRVTKGRIVNIISIGGKIAIPHLAPYSASKFALAGLSDAFRAELAREGIKVTSVFPGLLRTGSHLQALFKGQVEKEYAWFALGSATPLTSMSARRAVRQIVAACRDGIPQLIISRQARLAALAAALFPNLTARITGIANRVLPDGGASGKPMPGWKAAQGNPPRTLMVLANRASSANNEIPTEGP